MLCVILCHALCCHASVTHAAVMNRDLHNEVKLEISASERDLDLWNEVKLALCMMDAWNIPGRMVNCLLDV